MLKVHIATDSAAFDGEAERPELARLLRLAAAMIEAGVNGKHGQAGLQDVNGILVGSWRLEPTATAKVRMRVRDAWMGGA